MPYSGKLRLLFLYTILYPFFSHKAEEWKHHLHFYPNPTEYQSRYVYLSEVADTVSVLRLYLLLN